MKVIIFMQRLIAVCVMCFGILVTFSEVPASQSIWSQLFVTLGGIAIVLSAVGWMALTSWEERIVETGKKAI